MRKRTTPELESALQKAHQFHKLVEAALASLVAEDPRMYAVFGFCNVALEHHHAIVHLIELDEHDSSAAALFRSLLETVHRGVWVQECATDLEVDKIRTSDFDYGKFLPMVDTISEQLALGSKIEIPQKAWKLFNSLTHTGFAQLIRQYLPDGSIESNYRPEELIDIVQLSAVQLAIIGVIVCGRCKRVDLARAISDLRTKLFPVEGE
jgi:hypothetical protein